MGFIKGSLEYKSFFFKYFDGMRKILFITKKKKVILKSGGHKPYVKSIFWLARVRSFVVISKLTN